MFRSGRTVRFSLYINPQTRGPEDDGPVIEAVTQQALEADAAGFAAVFLTEHHFTNYNAFSDSFMFGAYLAPQLTRAWLGLSVAVPPLHHPLRFAEHSNLLDRFTNGRAIIGIGVGGSPLEFAGYGRDTAARRELTDQVLEIALKAWAHQFGDPPLEYEVGGIRGRLEGRIIPASVRRPHPLIARACVSDQSVVASAERGWPVFTGRFGPQRTAHQWDLYRQTLGLAGQPSSVVRECLDWSAMLKLIYVAETDAEARAEVGEPLDSYLRAAYLANSADHIEAQMTTPAANGESASPSLERDQFMQRAMIIGSPASIAAQLQEYAELGVTHTMVWLTWGYNDAERVRRSLRLFVEEVLPRFRQPQRARIAAEPTA